MVVKWPRGLNRLKLRLAAAGGVLVVLGIAGIAMVRADATSGYQSTIQFRAAKNARVAQILAAQAPTPAKQPRPAPAVIAPTPPPRLSVKELDPREAQISWIRNSPNILSLWQIAVVGALGDTAWNPEMVYSGYVVGDSAQGFISVWVMNDSSAVQNGTWDAPNGSGAITITGADSGMLRWTGASGEHGTFDLASHQWSLG